MAAGVEFPDEDEEKTDVGEEDNEAEDDASLYSISTSLKRTLRKDGGSGALAIQ